MQQNIKVSAYCRVSTDKDEQINSLDSQRKYFKEYIEKNKDWTLVGI